MASEGPQAVPSVTDDRAATKPRVIPSNQVVILRESELTCDLSTAIQRVREDETTATSRILIVGPEDPADRSENDPLPLPGLPMSIGQVARSGGAKALQGAGARLAPKLESLDYLLGEARRALDASPPQAKIARDVLDWVEATTGDLRREVDGLRDGFQQFDVHDMLAELAGQAESFFPGIRVNVGAASASCPCWGRAADLTEGLFLAIVITAHRIGGEGSVNIEAEPVSEVAGSAVSIRITGLGEPTEVHAQEQLDRFREIVVEQHGGRIVPDAMGPFGTGMVLQLRSQPQDEPADASPV